MVMTVEERKASARVAANKFYANNKEKVKAASKAYRDNNKEKCRVAKNKYNAKNRDKVNALSRKWVSENKDTKRAIVAKYAEENRDMIAANNAAYRAKKFGATIYMTKEDKAKITELYAIARNATKLFGYGWEVDHIVPLAQGGLHKLSNLQVVPGYWNAAKRDRNCDTYWD